MYPTIFQWGHFTLHSWGLMLSIAVIVSTLLLAREVNKRGLDIDPFIDLVLIVVFGGLMGARVFYVIFYDLNYYITNPVEIIKFWEGGLVFYGGLMGGLVSGYWFLKVKKIKFWPTADLVSPYLALGYAIVRIGCFLNGCCYGITTTVAWGATFPAVDQVLRHPTQIYLSVFSFSIFVVLSFLLKRKAFDGQIVAIYLIVYSVGRFVIEFYRDNLYLLPYVTVGQLVSVITLGLGIGFYFLLGKRGVYSD